MHLFTKSPDVSLTFVNYITCFNMINGSNASRVSMTCDIERYIFLYVTYLNTHKFQANSEYSWVQQQAVNNGRHTIPIDS